MLSFGVAHLFLLPSTVDKTQLPARTRDRTHLGAWIAPLPRNLVLTVCSFVLDAPSLAGLVRGQQLFRPNSMGRREGQELLAATTPGRPPRAWPHRANHGPSLQ